MSEVVFIFVGMYERFVYYHVSGQCKTDNGNEIYNQNKRHLTKYKY